MQTKPFQCFSHWKTVCVLDFCFDMFKIDGNMFYKSFSFLSVETRVIYMKVLPTLALVHSVHSIYDNEN